MGLLDRGLEIKDRDQIRLMRRAGLVVGETLELLRSSVRAGISTAELLEAGAVSVHDPPRDLLEHLDETVLGRTRA